MVEIMTAESIARDSIKNTLALEIPLVNENIETAKKNGRRSCYFEKRISNGTVRILEKAGYEVDFDSISTDISWEGIYNNLMNSEKSITEISQELNLRIIDINNSRNIIDPNWKPSNEDD